MSNRLRSLLPQTRGAKLFFAILAGYVVLFTWLGIRKFEACSTQSGDTAIFESAFYNTLQGNFFWCFGSASSYFEAHPEPLLLLYVPLYAIAPSPEMLIFLQTLCLAVSAVPVFLVGRKLLGHDGGGIVGALALLLFPSLVSQNVGQVHTVAFALPFLMFAFYFFRESRYGPFVVMLALASLGKESMPITAAMFGLYALWERRSWKWVVTGAAIPVGLLAINLFVVRPQFAVAGDYPALQYFPGMGDSLGGFLKTILTQPWLVGERVLTGRNFLYLVMLTGAVGYLLPWLAREAIFVAPVLFINLLSSNDGMKTVIYLYNYEVGAFLVVACLFGAYRVQGWLERSLGAGRSGVVIMGGVAVLCLTNWWQWFNPAEYRYHPMHAARQAAIAMVPDDDSLVAGPGQILAHLGHRKLLADQKMIALYPEQMFNFNWVLFDMNFQRPVLGEFVPREIIMAYGTNTAYELKFAEANIYVFRRKEPYPVGQLRPIRYMSDEPLLKRLQSQGGVQ